MITHHKYLQGRDIFYQRNCTVITLNKHTKFFKSKFQYYTLKYGTNHKFHDDLYMVIKIIEYYKNDVTCNDGDYEVELNIYGDDNLVRIGTKAMYSL